MDDYFLRQLSTDTQSLVYEIEGVLEKPIEFVCRANIGTLGCTFELGKPCILAPVLDQLPEGAVIHELLHLRRWAVEGVKRLKAGDGYLDLDSNVVVLDNGIEHLFILPEEIRRWPRRKGYWENKLLRKLKGVKESKAPAVDILSHCILCYALALRAVPSVSLHRGWRNYLVATRREKLVYTHVEEILSAQSKEVIVDIMVTVLEIPKDVIEFA